MSKFLLFAAVSVPIILIGRAFCAAAYAQKKSGQYYFYGYLSLTALAVAAAKIFQRELSVVAGGLGMGLGATLAILWLLGTLIFILIYAYVIHQELKRRHGGYARRRKKN